MKINYNCFSMHLQNEQLLVLVVTINCISAYSPETAAITVNKISSNYLVGLTLRGGQDHGSTLDITNPESTPKTNQTSYAEILQSFGVSKEFLQKAKGEDAVEKRMRKRFVIGAREPAWKQALRERELNGSFAEWCPLPYTALPYEQPTGLWRPGMAPDGIKQRSTQVDSYSEAAASGYAPHNYKAWEPVAGLMHRWPHVWGPTVRRMDEEALRGGDTMETFEYSGEELDHILLSFPDLSPQQKTALETTAAQIASRGKYVLACAMLPFQIAQS